MLEDAGIVGHRAADFGDSAADPEQSRNRRSGTAQTSVTAER